MTYTCPSRCSEQHPGDEHELGTDHDTARVLLDVDAVRRLQVGVAGWTREHDDQRHPQPGRELISLAKARVTSSAGDRDGYLSRHRMIEGIAMLVAAVEVLDRNEARGGVFHTGGVPWSRS